MKETEHLTILFEDIYNGDPWIDINLLGTLTTITAAQAAKKQFPQWNSIWEIVNHLISWRLNVLQRVQGKVIRTPAHNYFEPVTIQTQAAWKDTLKRLEESQQQWLIFLKKMKPEELEKSYPGNNHSYYKHIQGIIQHDAYHLGQIVVLAKLV